MLRIDNINSKPSAGTEPNQIGIWSLETKQCFSEEAIAVFGKQMFSYSTCKQLLCFSKENLLFYPFNIQYSCDTQLRFERLATLEFGALETSPEYRI